MSDYTISEAVYLLSRMVNVDEGVAGERLENYLSNEIHDLATRIPQREAGNYPNTEEARQKIRITDARLKSLPEILFPEKYKPLIDWIPRPFSSAERKDPNKLLDMVAEAASKLRPDERLYFVLGMLDENLRYQYCSSREIFKAAYGDPDGSEYWRGWFDKPGMTVVEFVDLLATHMGRQSTPTLMLPMTVPRPQTSSWRAEENWV